MRKRKRKRNRYVAIADRANCKRVKASSGNAFDDILYNSDSDESDGEERQPQQTNKQSRKDRKAGEQQFIRNEGDQPMDLLSRSIAGGISSEF